MKYNYQDCLTQVKINEQVAAEYEYDTSRQRIIARNNVTDNHSTIIYHWNESGQIIEEETDLSASPNGSAISP